MPYQTDILVIICLISMKMYRSLGTNDDAYAVNVWLV